MSLSIKGNVTKLVVLILATALPTTTLAHAFVQSYRLPLPYHLYIIGAVAALLLSFLLVGLFVRGGKQQPPSSLSIGNSRFVRLLRRIKPALQLLSVALLLLCIVSGLFGTTDPRRNFNMTFFWLIFALGGLYLSVFIGDFFAALNPWKILSQCVQKIVLKTQNGLLRYPRWLSYWPACLFYFVFVWLELLGFVRPYSLSVWLLIYSGINLSCAFLFGVNSWFRYGEFFSVMFRLASKLAPINYQPDIAGENRLQLRKPFSGLATSKPEHGSLLIFILFMLSSTAFDGLRDTVLWFSLFWKDATGLIQPLIGEHPIHAYVWLRPWYVLYESIWLFLSPFLYFGAYWLFLWLGKTLSRTQLTNRELTLKFAYSLLPIALVYHATHYYTLLLSQGIKIRALISDPLGKSWDIFGTAYTLRRPLIPDMGTVWYSQVGLIVLGHVVAVAIAHKIALQMLPGRRQALLNQLPVLLWMMFLTAAGLWILAQPLQGR